MARIESFIKQLTTEFPAIKSIWLFGSRANGNPNNNSDWDLMVFADINTFEKMKKATHHKDSRIDLLVVYNGDEFEEPWSDSAGARKHPKGGSLTEWEWEEISSREASYTANKILPDGERNSETKKARRVWP